MKTRTIQRQGWIKLYRTLRDNPISRKPNYLTVWIYLLLNASHSETTFIWNNQKQTLKSGQLLTGRKKMSEKTGVAESQVYKILKYLEKEQQIKQQKTTKFTIITIVNWDIYQQEEQQKEQQSNNKGTTKEQQSNTYKNDKNDKNDKKIKKTKKISKEDRKKIKILEKNHREELDVLMKAWSGVFKTQKTSTRSFEKNYIFWREQYSFEDIKKAFNNFFKFRNNYWAKSASMTFLFRTRDKNGECDRIAELLNLSSKKDV